MAAPNLKNPNTITGKTQTASLSTTSVTSILSNASNSDKVLKINSIFASNVSASATTVNISVSVYDGTNDRYLCKTLAVPAYSTQIISTKESYFYVVEGSSIRALASSANGIDIVIGYEEIV
jgi:hypothetical protein